MKKIRLDVESLAVESFATGADDTDEGTVRAHSEASVNFCPSINACLPPPTSRQTCARQLTNYASCIVDCECTNRLFACLERNTDV